MKSASVSNCCYCSNRYGLDFCWVTREFRVCHDVHCKSGDEFGVLPDEDLNAMPEILIDSLDDPALDIYRSLRKTNANRFRDVFIAEGINVVERLIHSKFQVESVLVTSAKRERVQELLPDDVPVYVLEKSLATMLVGFTFHMGILAAGRRESPGFIQYLAGQADGGLVLFGDRIIDQQNVGLLIRIASAFGATALVLANGSADPFSRRAIRVSMGNGFSLPIFQAEDSVDALTLLKQNGFQTFATVLDSTAMPITECQFPKKSALVFGNESHGLSEEVQAFCDARLTIDMLNNTDSLNIAIAAGIFGYAYRTQQ